MHSYKKKPKSKTKAIQRGRKIKYWQLSMQLTPIKGKLKKIQRKTANKKQMTIEMTRKNKYGEYKQMRKGISNTLWLLIYLGNRMMQMYYQGIIVMN